MPPSYGAGEDIRLNKFQKGGWSASLAILAIALAGCGRTPPAPQPPAPPAQTVDVAALLFPNLPAYRLESGQAWVQTSNTNGLLVLVTFNPADATETHSVYRADPAANCIRVVADETHRRADQALVGVQKYTAEPCWAPLTATSGQAVTRIVASPFTWAGADGRVTTTGTFSETVTLTVSSAQDGAVKDYFWTAEPPDYCMVRTYRNGFRSLAPGQCP